MKIYIVFLNDIMLKGYTTKRKAIEEVERLKQAIPKDEYGFYYRYEELDVEDVENVLEKQEPRKVTELHGDGGFCPICRMHALDTFVYCSKCGQKLAWED